MFAWLKKIFSSKSAETTPAASIETPAASIENQAENLTGTEESASEAPAEDMK